MKDRRRIMFVLPRMNGGGAERVVSTLSKHLCENYDVTLLVLVSNESFYQLDSRIHFISAMFEVNRRNKITRLASLACNFFQAIYFVRKQVKIVSPHIVFSILEESDIVTALALIGLKKIFHISSERNDPEARNTLIQGILNRIYRRCDCFVCQSERVAKYYSSIPDSKKCVIPNPVNFSGYPERIGEGKIKRIVGVGRLKPQKNFELLIDSFGIIAPRYPEVQLDIYGEGTLRKRLQRQINNLKLEKRVTLRGASTQVLKDIRDASLFVMSSDFEGFPNALVEAVAIGIPVISTDFPTGVAREIVTDEVGMVVPCNDKEALADAMDKLLSDAEWRNKIRNNGYKAVDRFESSHVMQIWDHVLTKVIAEYDEVG